MLWQALAQTLQAELQRQDCSQTCSQATNINEYKIQALAERRLQHPAPHCTRSWCGSRLVELPTGARRRMTRHSGQAIVCLTTFQQEVITTADLQSLFSKLDRSAS